jgi:hypothetical protein
MRARLVTGYIPLPGQVRTPAEYGELGEKLGGVPVRKKAFYQRVEETWMNRFLNTRAVMPQAVDRGQPDQEQHPLPLRPAPEDGVAARRRARVPGRRRVRVGRLRHLPPAGRQQPSDLRVHGARQGRRDLRARLLGQAAVVESAIPCWRFCGSVLAVPRKLVEKLHFACVKTAMKHVRTTNNVEWEVNTWARVEKNQAPVALVQGRPQRLPVHQPPQGRLMLFSKFRAQRLLELCNEPWGDIRIPDLQEVYECARPRRVLEIGSFRGVSTEFWALHCARVVSIDPSPNMAVRRDLHARLAHYPHVKIIEGLAPLFPEGYERRFFDLIYLDGDHSYAGPSRKSSSSTSRSSPPRLDRRPRLHRHPRAG